MIYNPVANFETHPLVMNLKPTMFVLKFIYSKKAKRFCEISTVDLTGTIGKINDGDFAKFCGLLRIYEL